MASKRAVIPPANIPWVHEDGRPAIAFLSFMRALAENNIGPLTTAVDDAAAAKAGVAIGALYENGGAVRIRKG